MMDRPADIIISELKVLDPKHIVMPMKVDRYIQVIDTGTHNWWSLYETKGDRCLVHCPSLEAFQAALLEMRVLTQSRPEYDRAREKKRRGL